MNLNNMTAGEFAYLDTTLRELQEAGYTVTSANDGGDRIKVACIEAALEVVNSVDESWLYLTGGPLCDPPRIVLYVILGNAEDGSEVIADCTDCQIMETVSAKVESMLGAD